MTTILYLVPKYSSGGIMTALSPRFQHAIAIWRFIMCNLSLQLYFKTRNASKISIVPDLINLNKTVCVCSSQGVWQEIVDHGSVHGDRRTAGLSICSYGSQCLYHC